MLAARVFFSSLLVRAPCYTWAAALAWTRRLILSLCSRWRFFAPSRCQPFPCSAEHLYHFRFDVLLQQRLYGKEVGNRGGEIVFFAHEMRLPLSRIADRHLQLRYERIEGILIEFVGGTKVIVVNELEKQNAKLDALSARC